MNLDIKLEQKNNNKILYLTGEIDAYTAPVLRDELLPLTEQNEVVVIVNLADVSYIDSTGLGVFIGALKSSHSHNSSIKLTCLSTKIQRLFSITGLDEVMDIDEIEREGAQ
ncbi:STAS domain-containing protein [Bacillus sp. FJAT-45350]|uniref:STAS domain-containing protein n=1 Tax=Bacillus sp. FJAT-45350 TaxID=2011014 RepID=UPI000BB6A653|nr:STAS domain-containing protein [Bacillus sp. FJAT-45350]